MWATYQWNIMRNLKLNFLSPVLALIIVAMGFFIAYQCQSAKVQNLERLEGNRLTQERIAKLQEQAQSAAHRADELAIERGKLRDSVRVAVMSQKSEIQAFKKEIARLRPTVAAKIDSFPDLRAFVAYQDSTIEAQDSTITTLELGHSAEVISYEQELKERGKEVMAGAQQKEQYLGDYLESDKKVKKLNRKVRFWKVCTGVGAALVVYLSVK